MANADIDPPADYLKACPDAYQGLIRNTPVSAKFAEHEAVALEAKRRYTALGGFSLLAAFVTFGAVIYAVTLESLWFPIPEDRPSETVMFKAVFAGVGLVGAAVQLYLLKGPLKHRWLDARFAAERLRCIKFQAFQSAACSDNPAAAVERFTDLALGKLAVELHDKSAARHHFDAEQALLEEPSPCAKLSPDALAALKDVYLKLRIDYQAQHAMGQIKILGEERKLPAAASEITFWGGVLLAYLDAIFAFVAPSLGVDEEAWRPYIHFLTLMLFVSSALLFVLEHGRSHNEALERYEDYRLAMTRVAGGLERAQTADEFVACVRAGERAALRELKAFCREAEKSTYIF